MLRLAKSLSALFFLEFCSSESAVQLWRISSARLYCCLTHTHTPTNPPTPPQCHSGGLTSQHTPAGATSYMAPRLRPSARSRCEYQKKNLFKCMFSKILNEHFSALCKCDYPKKDNWLPAKHISLYITHFVFRRSLFKSAFVSLRL